MFNNNNNPGGGNPPSNTGIGVGDFGGSGVHSGGHGRGNSPSDDLMSSMYHNVGGNDNMSAAARFGMGGGSDMMGMNVMGNMNSNLGSMGGMGNMGGMGGMGSMSGMSGMGNMPTGMSSRMNMDNMDMIALYRAKEKMAMMNARRAAFLGGSEDKFGSSGMGMGLNGPSFSGDDPLTGIGMKRHSPSEDLKLSGPSLKGKRRKKTKKPVDMPRRALSAYNIFFSEQREKILQEIDERDAAKKKKDDCTEGDKQTEGDEDKTSKIKSSDSTDVENQDEQENTSPAKGNQDKDDGSSSENKEKGEKTTKQDPEEGDDKDDDKGEVDVTKEEVGKSAKDDEAKKKKDSKSEPKVMNRTFFPTRAKRAHRKVHGKIGLVDLAREVSRRWKVLDQENRAHYESLAEEDRKRHKQVMAEYQERKAAENMLSMGGPGDEDEKDGKSKEKSSDNPNAQSKSEQDIRETITHHHQQRILAEMMARQAGDPLLGSGSNMGSNFGMNLNRFGGGMGNRSMGGMNDMQSILDLQTQRAMMMQRMRMSGGMGGMGMDTMEGMGGYGMGGSGMGGNMGGSSMGGNMGGSGMGGSGIGGSGMGSSGMGGSGMGGHGMGGGMSGMGGMGGGMGPSL